MSEREGLRMNRKNIAAIAVIIIVCLAVVVFISSRGWIAKKMYERAGGRIESRLTQKQREKYSEELTYTLDKFWSCFEQDIVTQNDLTDVMERMKQLERKEEFEDPEVFEFIGYVSRTYTDAILQKQQESQRQ